MKQICCRCKIEKDLEEFHKQKRNPLGHAYSCKKCEHERYVKKKAKDPERWNLLSKLWHRKKKEEDPDIWKKRYQKSKERILNYIKSNKERDKIKLRARNNVNRWLRLGQITRAEKCSECGSNTKLEAHHEDYSKPREIKWLCVSCHVMADKKRREREKKEK